MTEKRLPIAGQRQPIPRSGPVLRVSRVYEFQAAHRLPYVPPEHKCSRLHGHTYSVEVEVSGQCDDALGWVCDFGRIDVAWDAIGKPLDHRYLNEIEGLQNPTSELLAVWLWRRFATHFGTDGATLTRITVYENGRSAATCEGV
jgi:6-pyruvoyltetrahydropterin/6-carboxytetrahydropterin synthase